MKLYEEIILLQNFAPKECKWVVENVKPYYESLIKPTAILQRHYFWSNFDIPDAEFEKDVIRKAQIPDLQKKYGFDLSKYKLKNKRQVLRNCVEPKLGKHILKACEFNDDEGGEELSLCERYYNDED